NLTLTFNWPQSAVYEANEYGNKTQYNDYLRIYAPPAATLNNTTGWNYLGATTEFGREAFGGFMGMNYPGTQVVTLNYTVPQAATEKGGVWTYPLLMQVESGHAPTDLWAVTMTITPPCGKVTTVAAPWTISGGGTSASLKESLSMDKSYTTTYTCAG
ncbi:MAG: hypothetical protein ACRDID_12880, partial [Ktedonobacterales bacterium]